MGAFEKFFGNHLMPADWANKKDAAIELLTPVLDEFDKLRGNKKFCVGCDPVYTDFLIYEFLFYVRTFDFAFFNGYSRLRTYVDNVSALTRMAEYEKA
jgi:glutathione S-transferase